MSIRPTIEPVPVTELSTPAVALIIDGRPRELGGFAVRRLLPASARRMVGPFIFLDHMGPAVFQAGAGMDVRPHPHIGLSTVTYLFQGEILHRDSLGSNQVIRPGDVNWMTAGRGIVHSERTSPERRLAGGPSHGLQLWVALPQAHEETEPAFHHHPRGTLPVLERAGVRIRVVAGTAYGITSPVRIFSPLFYVEVLMPAGCRLVVPREHQERAAYVAEGAICCGAQRAEAGRMFVFSEGADVVLRAPTDARVALIGGAPLDGERHIEWNFVSSSKERIERAKLAWKNGDFPKVPGDEVDVIPLPE